MPYQLRRRRAIEVRDRRAVTHSHTSEPVDTFPTPEEANEVRETKQRKTWDHLYVVRVNNDGDAIPYWEGDD